MKRAVYLSILGVVTAVCIVIGIAGRIGRFSIGKTHDYYGKKVILEDEKLDEFQKIEFDTAVLSGNIVKGDDYTISYEASEKLVPDYYVENGTLYVKQKDDLKLKDHLGGNTKMKITITIPDGVCLENIEVGADVGDVNIEGIKTSQFTCDADVGDIDVKNAELGIVKFTADVGDINIDSAIMADASVEASVGNIDMKEVKVQNADITADVGDVAVKVIGNRDDYNLKLNAGLGDVKVDGEHSSSHIENNTNGMYTFEVDGGVGNVRVDFEN